MATSPQDIQRILDRLNATYRQLGESNPFENLDPSRITDAATEAQKLTDALNGAQQRLRTMDGDLDGLVGAFKAVTGELSSQNVFLNRTNATFRGLTSLSQKLRDDQAGINKLSLKELESLKAKALSRQKELADNKINLTNRLSELRQQEASQDLIDRHIDALKIVNDEYEEADSLTNNLIASTDRRIEQEKQINANLGITGGLLKGAEGLMGKLGLGALAGAVGFDKINEELREYSEELENSDEILTDAEKKQRIMGRGFQLLGNSVKEALSDPLVLVGIAVKAITSLVSNLADGFKRSQENTGSLAKNLNITNGEAMELSKSMSEASFGSDRLFVSSKGLTETLVAINSELGTTVQLSTEELLTFTKLRETAGLTNEELMGMEKLSLANGKSFDANTDALLNQVTALNNSSGKFINQKTVLKEVSKLSAATTLSLGKNPKLLAEAVQVTKSLGMEMEQVDAIASSLLDFESSIGAELEAELLLNKDLNLEKARQAALNNDLATVAKEIADQAGSSAEFAEMNRIQQEALAKSVGMSREDLAQTLFTQEAIGNVGEEEAKRRQKLLDARIEEVGLAQAQREVEEGGLKNMLDQATAAEKMEASMGKINELFTALGAMFAPIVNMFADVAGYISSSKIAMVALSAAVGGLVSVLSIMAIKSIVTAIASIFTGAMSLGPFGIPLAIGGVAALVGAVAGGVSAAKAVGDVMSPADGKTQISTKEGGLFELSKNDDLIAAPGAAARMQGGGGTTVVKQDNSETNNLLKQLIQTNQEGNSLQKKKPELSPVGLYEVQ
jgi:hypothetical protein